MNGEKSANKAFPQDTEETEGRVGTPEQSQKQNAGTTNVVQTEPGLEALKELADYVNTQCVRLWEQIVKNRQLIHHTNREVSRAIVGVVDDVCSDAQNEESFYRCLMAYHVMASVLLGRTPRNEPVCPLAMRLIEEETRKSLDQVRDRLKDVVNATLNRLDIAPERKSELERRAIEHIMEGRFYVDIVLERIKALTVQRMKPLDFRNFVTEAEINEFENKIMIHVIIPKAGETADATENLESFTIVSDLKKVGTAYLVGRDFEYFVSDLSRPEAVVLPSPPKEKGKEDSDLWAIGNFTVVIPDILRPALDRFLRMGWIPDGTTAEFLDAIRDKIKVIKTPEELFADTLARVLSGYRWVVVDKTESGQYELESDIPITTENPWQRYTFLVPADGEIWIPNPMWRKAKDMFEKVRIPRDMIEYIIKSKKTGRSASTCGSGRTIEMHNLVVLDIERVKEVLGDEIENHIVFKEPPCEGEGE